MGTAGDENAPISTKDLNQFSAAPQSLTSSFHLLRRIIKGAKRNSAIPGWYNNQNLQIAESNLLLLKG